VLVFYISYFQTQQIQDEHMSTDTLPGQV